MTTTERIAQMNREAAEAKARKMIAELSPAHLKIIGLDTPEAIEAHIAASLADGSWT